MSCAIQTAHGLAVRPVMIYADLANILIRIAVEHAMHFNSENCPGLC